MVYAKDWVFAFIMYADENRGQFPTNFDQALSFLPDQAKAEANLTTDQFEIVYRGKWDTLTNGGNVIVLREKQARQYPDGKWAKAYRFADGHSDIHGQEDGNFDAWEKQRIILPAPSNQ